MRIIVIATIFFFAVSGRAAEIRLLCDGPLIPALTVIARAFEAETGHVVRLDSATSPELMARLGRGEIADAVAIQRALLDRLVADRLAVEASRFSLGRIGLGLSMRAGAMPFHVDDMASLRAALLSADTVIFNDVASGEYFATVIARLGIAADLAPRILRTNAASVFRRLLDGQGRDIAVATMSQILSTRGVVLLAPLPGEVQAWLSYDVAPLAAAPEPVITRQRLAFLQWPSSRAAFAAAGGEIMAE